jgi:hypothetical protein
MTHNPSIGRQYFSVSQKTWRIFARSVVVIISPLPFFD